MKKLSYFRTLLEKHLHDHFPELSDREDFINTRVDLAEETFCEARKQGKDVYTALEYGHDQLFGGLEFSQFDYLSEIVNDNFSEQIPLEPERRSFCIRLLPHTYSLFDKYQAIHNILGDHAYDKLKTELTGFIENFRLKNGL